METYWVQCHISLTSCDLVVSSWVALADVQGRTICGSEATEFVIFSLEVQTGLPSPSGSTVTDMQINVMCTGLKALSKGPQRNISGLIFSFGGHAKPLAP